MSVHGGVPGWVYKKSGGAASTILPRPAERAITCRNFASQRARLSRMTFTLLIATRRQPGLSRYNRLGPDVASLKTHRGKGSRMLPVHTSRRRFLSRGFAGLGVVGFLGRRSGPVSGQTISAVPEVGTMIDRAVKFLRPRQDAKGGWSTQREPGITALVVTALLRSGQVPPGDPMVTQALRTWKDSSGPRGDCPRRLTRITRRRSPWWRSSRRTLAGVTIA